jgi:hypothetical protein
MFTPARTLDFSQQPSPYDHLANDSNISKKQGYINSAKMWGIFDGDNRIYGESNNNFRTAEEYPKSTKSSGHILEAKSYWSASVISDKFLLKNDTDPVELCVADFF